MRRVVRMYACAFVMGQSLLMDFNKFIRRPRPLMPASPSASWGVGVYIAASKPLMTSQSLQQATQQRKQRRGAIQAKARWRGGGRMDGPFAERVEESIGKSNASCTLATTTTRNPVIGPQAEAAQCSPHALIVTSCDHPSEASAPFSHPLRLSLASLGENSAFICRNKHHQRVAEI